MSRWADPVADQLAEALRSEQSYNSQQVITKARRKRKKQPVPGGTPAHAAAHAAVEAAHERALQRSILSQITLNKLLKISKDPDYCPQCRRATWAEYQRRHV